MRESDYEEVLQYVQQQMRQYGLSELNDRIVSDLRTDPGAHPRRNSSATSTLSSGPNCACSPAAARPPAW